MDLLRALQYLWRYTKDENAQACQWSEKVIELEPK
jgi:hypothetical protein